MSEPEAPDIHRWASQARPRLSIALERSPLSEAKVTEALLELRAELRRIQPADLKAIRAVLQDIQSALDAGASEIQVLAALRAQECGVTTDCLRSILGLLHAKIGRSCSRND